jgi:hypothetical protein
MAAEATSQHDYQAVIAYINAASDVFDRKGGMLSTASRFVEPNTSHENLVKTIELVCILGQLNNHDPLKMSGGIDKINGYANRLLVKDRVGDRINPGDVLARLTGAVETLLKRLGDDGKHRVKKVMQIAQTQKTIQDMIDYMFQAYFAAMLLLQGVITYIELDDKNSEIWPNRNFTFRFTTGRLRKKQRSAGSTSSSSGIGNPGKRSKQGSYQPRQGPDLSSSSRQSSPQDVYAASRQSSRRSSKSPRRFADDMPAPAPLASYQPNGSTSSSSGTGNPGKRSKQGSYQPRQGPDSSSSSRQSYPQDVYAASRQSSERSRRLPSAYDMPAPAPRPKYEDTLSTVYSDEKPARPGSIPPMSQVGPVVWPKNSLPSWASGSQPSSFDGSGNSSQDLYGSGNSSSLPSSDGGSKKRRLDCEQELRRCKDNLKSARDQLQICSDKVIQMQLINDRNTQIISEQQALHQQQQLSVQPQRMAEQQQIQSSYQQEVDQYEQRFKLGVQAARALTVAEANQAYLRLLNEANVELAKLHREIFDMRVGQLNDRNLIVAQHNDALPMRQIPAQELYRMMSRLPGGGGGGHY